MSYRKQICVVILLLVLFTCLGLTVVSVNMERNTQRNGQDFLLLTTKSAGEWEIRLLGISLLINKEEIKAQILEINTQISGTIASCVTRGGQNIKKIADFLQERMLWIKNRQEAVYPIK